MIGPVVKTDAAAARAGSQLFQVLPPQVRLALLVLGLLVAMVGCSVAWVDYKREYRPSPNVCRAEQVAYAERANCVPPQQIQTPAGWSR